MTDLLGLPTDNLDGDYNDTLNYVFNDILDTPNGWALEKVLESELHHSDVLKGLVVHGNKSFGYLECKLVVNQDDGEPLKAVLAKHDISIDGESDMPMVFVDVFALDVYSKKCPIETCPPELCPIEVLLDRLGA